MTTRAAISSRLPVESEVTDEPRGCARTHEQPEWLKWKREGPEPAYWWATNPKTGELTKVYRSYKDYGND